MKVPKFSKETVRLIEAVDDYCMECPVSDGDICDECPVRACIDFLVEEKSMENKMVVGLQEYRAKQKEALDALDVVSETIKADTDLGVVECVVVGMLVEQLQKMLGGVYEDIGELITDLSK